MITMQLSWLFTMFTTLVFGFMVGIAIGVAATLVADAADQCADTLEYEESKDWRAENE